MWNGKLNGKMNIRGGFVVLPMRREERFILAVMIMEKLLAY